MGMVFPAVVVLIVICIFIVCVSGVSFLDDGAIVSNSGNGINSDIIYNKLSSKFREYSVLYSYS